MTIDLSDLKAGDKVTYTVTEDDLYYFKNSTGITALNRNITSVERMPRPVAVERWLNVYLGDIIEHITKEKADFSKNCRSGLIHLTYILENGKLIDVKAEVVK